MNTFSSSVRVKEISEQLNHFIDSLAVLTGFGENRQICYEYNLNRFALADFICQKNNFTLK